jgi:hypothetical protein
MSRLQTPDSRLQTPDTQSSRRAVVMHAADLETVDGSFPR